MTIVLNKSWLEIFFFYCWLRCSTDDEWNNLFISSLYWSSLKLNPTASVISELLNPEKCIHAESGILEGNNL